MRRIKLELVRHGPPHNQLLSPLTSYLALCQNHPPVTVHVPFEHNQFLHRLHGLNDKGDAQAREFELVEMGRAMGALLGQVPGLIAELSREGSQGVQLRLVLSSSELALLPFELAFAAEGMPGAGQPLLLQTEVPICLTREVRRSGSGMDGRGVGLGADRSETYTGEFTGERASILFAWAAPRDYEEVPHEAHLLALMRALDPWADWASEDPRRRQEPSSITVLPRASVQDIEAACRASNFSHVHILAHGNKTTAGLDWEYGLALHDEGSSDDRAEIVLGDRLASAVSPSTDSSATIVRPVAVTIASCYGSARASIASAAGSSVAHSLHVSGVPLVVASQFPLSHGASVRMVEIVYECLLWGKDPRLGITALRRSLQTELGRSHDWAAISAYLALATDFESMQPYAQVQPIEAIGNATISDPDSQRPRLEQLKRRLEEAMDEVWERLQNRVARDRPLVDRQFAKVRWTMAKVNELLVGMPSADPRSEGRCIDRLKTELPEIRDLYWAVVILDRNAAAPMVHYLWLDCLCRVADTGTRSSGAENGRTLEPDGDDRNAGELWASAHSSALLQRNIDRSSGSIFDLILLHLIATTLPAPPLTRTDNLALGYARELACNAPVHAQGLGRSIHRYARWLGLLVRSLVSSQPARVFSADEVDLLSRARTLMGRTDEVLVALGLPPAATVVELPAMTASGTPRKKAARQAAPLR